MNVGELCNREVVICTPDMPLLEAARRMRAHHVGDLIVVEGSDGHNEPVGVITDRDLVVDAFAVSPGSLEVLDVKDVMTAELVTSREDEDVASVLRRMRSFGIRRMPVVDEHGGLQGILTYDDILEWMVEELEDLVGVARSEQEIERKRF